MRKIAAVVIFLIVLFPAVSISANPDLVIVISLDQFPYEYLARFRPWFHGGLATLLDKGAVFSNANYAHMHCTTGPGHAVLLTGTYGNMNGIILNTWFNRSRGKNEYCVADDQSTIVGAGGQGVSPRNLQQFTFGDMLRMQTGFVAKVVSVSNKDRAAILLGGRIPSEVFWMIDSSFVTSSYYMASLPDWVSRFNTSGVINHYFGSVWEQTLPDSAFNQLDRDDAPYEAAHNGLGRTFPHRITGKDRSRITASYFDALWTSPYAARTLTTFAERALTEEQLGRRGTTDLLCMSYSSTDYVGHAYGPNSHEVLEMAVAIDRTLGDLFAFVDSTIGLHNCLIALSSDHGVAPIPEYVSSHVRSADVGRVQTDSLRAASEAALRAAFGVPPTNKTWILSVNDHEIYLDRGLLAEKRVDPARAADVVIGRLRTFPVVADAWNLDSPVIGHGKPWDARVLRSYSWERSGDLVYALRPLYIEGNGEGTTHGDPYQYNTHVPLILMGSSIKPGVYTVDVTPADLAPTLSAATGVEFPTGREGRVLWEAIR